MKILKIYPNIDTPSSYNYHINYDIWDKIDGDKVVLGHEIINFDNYDVLFLPMYKRWSGSYETLNRAKESRAKTVLFDNDSHYRKFSDPFYNNIDFIFYRCTDQDNNPPTSPSQFLKWSIDTSKYLPKYENSDVSFCCSVHEKYYPLRYEIDKQVIKAKSFKGAEYIKHLQDSSAMIHTAEYFDPKLTPIVRSKALEIASCGSEIISNPSSNMSDYYPLELIRIFKDISELKNIIKNFSPNIETQKKLRKITEDKHDSRVRAKEVVEKIKEVLF